MEIQNLLGFNSRYDGDLRRYHVHAFTISLLLLFVHAWLFGLRLLALAGIGCLGGVLVELAFARCRRKPVTGGAIVTGLLLALLVPPDLPLWMMALAAVVSTAFAQEAFGGMQTCLFHPALIGKAFLLVSYPVHCLKFSYRGVFESVAFGLWLILGVLLLGIILSLWLRPRTLLVYLGLALGAYMALRLSVGIDHLTEIANLKDCGAGDQLDMRFIFLNDHWLLVATLMAVAPCGLPRQGAGMFLTGFLAGAFGMLIRCFGRYSDAMAFAVLICDTIAPTLDWLFARHVFVKAGNEVSDEAKGEL